MEKYPKITIITPSYNQGAFIEDTILSIINQGYPNLQYIIIDGGSTDNTVDIIKKYDKYIYYWISEKDNGQSNAINKGLKLALGDLVNWINSDDLLYEKALFDIANLYIKNRDKKLFIGQTQVFALNKEYGKGGDIIFSSSEDTFAFGQMNQPAMFYSKDAIVKIGFLNESLHYCMDIDWWLKYLLYYPINTIEQSKNTWSRFRIHNESKTVSTPLYFKKEKYKLYKDVFKFYGLSNPNTGKWNLNNTYPITTHLNLKKTLNYYHLWRSDELMLEKKTKMSFKFLMKVNPLKLNFLGFKRYIAVLKNNILNLVSSK